MKNYDLPFSVISTPKNHKKSQDFKLISNCFQQGGQKYELQAGVMHWGEDVSGGHYTSIVRIDSEWWAVDDATWKKITNIKKTLLNIQGGRNNCSYLLQYKVSFKCDFEF